MMLFTADWHLCDKEQLSLGHRPFKSTDHMNEVIIANCNSRAKYGDVVFHLGDFIMKTKESTILKRDPTYYENRVRAKVVHVLGNHDRNNGLKDGVISSILEYGGHRILMTHKPPFVVPSDITLVLCGHVHKAWKTNSTRTLAGVRIPMINVGVDLNNYQPLKISEILKLVVQISIDYEMEYR